MTGTVGHDLNTIPNVDVDGVGGHYNLTELLAIDGAGTPQQLNCNQEIILLASAVRNATTATPNQKNTSAWGVAVFFNVTAVSGTGSVQCRIEWVDPVSGSVIGMLVPTAVTAIGTYGYAVFPAAPASSPYTAAANGMLPTTWRVRVIHADGSNYTYSVAASIIMA